jgi:hypothetical protein
MSVGFIVTPLGDDTVSPAELRNLARDLQESTPAASHWIDHPIVVEQIARHLNSRGHIYPNCEACP